VLVVVVVMVMVCGNLFLRQANQTPQGWYKDAPCSQQVGAADFNASSL
jgi:hypothetical protein